MPAAFEAAPLAGILILAVALALTVAALRILKPIFDVINDALGWVPFAGGWVEHATSKAIAKIEEAVVAERHWMAVMWQGFLWSIRETIAVIDHGADDLEAWGKQLVLQAIPAAFENLYADAKQLVANVAGDLADFKQAEAQDIKQARHYADGVAADALNTAESYTDAAVSKLHSYVGNAIDNAVSGVEQDITDARKAAIRVAEEYADNVRKAIEGELAQAIAGVETDLGNAVKSLTASLAQAETALQAAIGTAEATVEHELAADVAGLDQLIASAEATLGQAIAVAEATASSELAQLAGQLGADIAAVKAEADAVAAAVAAVPAAVAGELSDVAGLGVDDLRRLLDRLDPRSLAELGAGFVLTRALVEALTREAGLDRAECRSKVKGICGTDPSAWAGLLASLTAAGVALDLTALVAAARALAVPAQALIREANR